MGLDGQSDSLHHAGSNSLPTSSPGPAISLKQRLPNYRVVRSSQNGTQHVATNGQWCTRLERLLHGSRCGSRQCVEAEISRGLHSRVGQYDLEEHDQVAKFHIYRRSDGQYGWRLKASNGQTIATAGEGFVTKSGAENGVAAVKRDAPGAPTQDDT